MAPTLRQVLLSGVSVLALGTGLVTTPVAAVKASCGSGGNATISAACTGQYTWTSGDLSITNTGTISGGTKAVVPSGSVGTLTNSGGSISGNSYGLYNTGIVDAVSNSGTISALGSIRTVTGQTIGAAIYNSGTIVTLTNSSLISADTNAVRNSGSIGTLTNTGTLSGVNDTGFYNLSGGSIGALSNSGTISGGWQAFLNSGTVDTLSNSGRISGNNIGVDTTGFIGTVSNSGTISANNYYGIQNQGTIDTLSNSGTISAPTAIYNFSGHAIGTIVNSGLISGTVKNASSNAFTIGGGSGSTFGTFSGGSISNTSANLIFASGNILLGENVDVSGHTLTNSGATLKVTAGEAVTGNYDESGGALVIGVTNSTTYGHLTVSGNATVTNSTITISGTGLAKDEAFTIVQAGGTGSYSSNTGSVSGTSGLTVFLSVSGNDLVATLATATTYAQLGDSAGGAAVGMGPALDAISNSSSAAATAFKNSVLNTLDALPESAQLAAVTELAPTELQPAIQVTNLAVAPTMAAIEQHQLALAEGDGVGMAAGSGGHNSAVWGQVIGGAAVRGTTAEADGYRSHGFGLVGGFEHQATADLTVGVAVSWLRGWSWGSYGSNGSSLKTDTYQLTGYGLQHWGPWFVDGQLGVGYTQFREDRAIDFLGSTAHGKYDGTLYLAKAGVGYDFAVGGVTLTPLAGLRFVRVDSDGYTETGAGSADLTVDGHAVQSLTQDVGGELSWSTDTGWGRLTPEVRLAWVHDYEDGPIASSGLIGGEAFTSDVARPSADGARLNLAATLDHSDELSVRAEFEGEYRHDYESGTALLKVSWKF